MEKALADVKTHMCVCVCVCVCFEEVISVFKEEHFYCPEILRRMHADSQVPKKIVEKKGVVMNNGEPR